MHSYSAVNRMKQRFAAMTLGLVVAGAPTVSFAQGAPPPPPPPPDAMPPPPGPPPGYQQPPPGYQQPPPGYQQPPPGYQQPPPYPYAPPGYPPPYGYPPGYGPVWQAERPETLPYKENTPPPPGYKTVEQRRKALLISGGVIFGVTYLFSVLGGVQNLGRSEAPYGALFVPVIGPFIVAGAGNFPSAGSVSSSSDGVNSPKFAYIVDGILQTGGGAMFLIGMLAKRKVYMREDLAQVMKPEVIAGPGFVGMKMRF